jgi:hypothetical protein
MFLKSADGKERHWIECDNMVHEDEFEVTLRDGAYAHFTREDPKPAGKKKKSSLVEDE